MPPDTVPADSGLKQGLGFVGVYALIITSMIGTSLFFGISKGAALAGPASVIAWFLIGFVTIYVASCFGELISMYPTSGGVYEFTKQAYGRFPSFLVGWMSWIVSNVGSAVLVVAALEFLLPGTGTVLIQGFLISKGLIKLTIAIVIILLFNAIAYRGIDASQKILVICAAAILVLVVGIIISGSSSVTPIDLSAQSFSNIAIMVTVFFLVESFFGWESASFLAEETRDATRVIPRALVWASTTMALFGIGLAIILFANYPSDVLAQDPNPVVTLVKDQFPGAVPIVIGGVFIAFLSGVISNVISSPRLLFALARDRLFIEQCTKLHPRYKSPVNAILFQTVVTIVVIIFAFGKYEFLLSMLVPIALIMYAAVLVAVPLLRKTKPHHARPYKVWGGSWLPILVALFYFGVVLGWFFTTPQAASAIILIAGFMLLAVPIYWFVTIIYNPDAIISVNDSAARASFWLEDFLLPRPIRKELIASFGEHLEGKTVLEYGAGVGTFTMTLAEAVGPRGAILASDISESNLEILAERARKRGHNIRTILDEHQMNRVHPDITHADVVYSVGFLGYVQDLGKVLRELQQILPDNGRICFVEYTNLFKVLPDPAIVADVEKLRTTFQNAGFAIAIKKRPGFLWNYIIIEGIKTDKKVAYV